MRRLGGGKSFISLSPTFLPSLHHPDTRASEQSRAEQGGAEQSQRNRQRQVRTTTATSMHTHD